jgi:hypothetical protein
MSTLQVHNLQGLNAYNNEIIIPNGHTLNVSGGSMKMSAWSNTTRPPLPQTGYFGVNTDTGSVEFYNGSEWTNVGGGKSFTRLTTPGYWTTSFTSGSTGSLSASGTFGVPSNATALLVSGYYHITGYSSGHNDHVTCIFGGYPNASTASNWSFTAATTNIWQEFVLYHDGDSSGSPHYYGYWTDGGVISTNSNTIYYELGKGRSGGTHYVHLWCFGYWR